MLLDLRVDLLGRLFQDILASTSDVHLGPVDSEALGDVATNPGAAASN